MPADPPSDQRPSDQRPSDQRPYDALVVVSFGGPEGPDDVLPFLRNVTAGRAVPDERLAAVAEHYHHFGGVSPINAQNRALAAALAAEVPLPVYFGNRNWAPYLADSLADMAAAGVQRALALVTSAYSSYSGCRQYLDDIERARLEVGKGAPVVDKLRNFFDLPGFIDANAARLRAALDSAALGEAGAGPAVPVLFSAHSIPEAMAACCAYADQLAFTAKAVAEAAGVEGPWQVTYQSRSGPPSVPWLGPDVADALLALPVGTPAAVVAPIGFVSDHMEVAYDLDVELAAVAAERGIRLVRAGTAGTHPAFVRGLAALVAERCGLGGREGICPTPAPDVCPPGHCSPGRRA